jgi:single-strand DNA-binding protein
LNTIEVVGNVVKEDPVLKFSASTGNAHVRFSVSDSRKVNGEYVNQYWTVVAFKDLAEQICTHVGKGTRVVVKGRVEFGEYEKDGVKHPSWTVIADSVSLVMPKLESSAGSGAATSTPVSDEDLF